MQVEDENRVIEDKKISFLFFVLWNENYNQNRIIGAHRSSQITEMVCE